MKFIRFLFSILSSDFRLFLIPVILWPPVSQAQVYNVTPYRTSDNLVQSQVMAMYQDQDGYLWFGTHRGPCKFDGKNFTALPKDSLSGNFLTDISENRQRRHLYFATQSGLTLFDGYRYFQIPSTFGSAALPILCMMHRDAETLWLGTQGYGIFRLSMPNPDSLRPTGIGNAQFWSNHNVIDLEKSPEGNIWIATDKGVYLCDPDGSNFRPWKEAEFGDKEIHGLFIDGRRVFFGTDDGAYMWTGQFLSLFQPTKHGGSEDGVYCFTRDKNQQIWMGTDKGVLYMNQEGDLQFLKKLDKSLDFHMQSALADLEGNIWFGTDGGGARKITPGVFQPYTMEEGLSSNQAKSFLRDRHGDIWVSTRDRGINIMRLVGEEYEPVRILDSRNSGLGGNDICYSYEDRQGRFWFASYSGTLSMWDPIARTFRVFDESKGLAANAVYVVAEEGRTMWIGTDKGLYRMVDDQIVGHLTTEDGLSSNLVYALFHDPEDDLFAVGTAAALSLRSRSGLFETLSADSTVIGKTVIALTRDSRDRLWVGSAIGLAWMRQGEAHHVRISDTDGAHTIIGLRIEYDQRGRDKFLWIATENGVYRLDLRSFDEAAPEKTNFDHFTQKDGLPSMECNANAIFIDRQEESIWIGTAEGAIRKRAFQEPETDSIPPSIYINEVGVEGQIDWRDMRGSRVDERGLPIDLELPYNQNRLDFSWIGISLRSPQQVEYQFYLDGLDQDWPKNSSRLTSFSYPNLDPGTYTFRVRAKKEKVSTWEEAEVASFSFTIQPPYYQRWWFVLLMAWLLAAIGYLVYRYVTQRRRQRLEEQKIRDTSEKLQLEHQALYAMMNPHFTFNALNAIKLFIHRQDRKAADKFLSAFAKLVRMNLESTKSDFISLEEELRRLELFMDLTKVRFPDQLETYEVVVDQEVEVYDTQIPPMLLQPFVENSIEHGIKPLESGGKVEVLISQMDEDYLRILIRDNGIGIEASLAAKAGRPKDHVSRGMEITKDRLRLFARMTGKQYSLDIRELKAEDGSSQGTEVEMILPIKYG